MMRFVEVLIISCFIRVQFTLIYLVYILFGIIHINRKILSL